MCARMAKITEALGSARRVDTILSTMIPNSRWTFSRVPHMNPKT